MYMLNELYCNTVIVPCFSHQPAECDSKGNVYYDLSESRHSAQKILRISNDGKTVFPFTASLQSEAQGVYVSYYVSPDGEVDTIVSQTGQSTLTRHSSSGEVLTSVTLPLPRYFLLQSFAVLDDQSAMLVGITPLSETTANPA